MSVNALRDRLMAMPKERLVEMLLPCVFIDHDHPLSLPEKIQEIVAAACGISVDRLRTGCLGEESRARHMAFFAVRTYTQWNHRKVSGFFERDHGTSIWAIRAFLNRLETEPSYGALWRAVKDEIEGWLADQKSKQEQAA